VYAAATFLLCIAGLGLTAPIFFKWLGLPGLALVQVLFFLAFPLLLLRLWAGYPSGTIAPLKSPLRLLLPALLLVPATLLFVGMYEGFQEFHLFPYREELLASYRETIVRPGASPLWLVLAVAVIPAICEEFFFRGFLLGALAEHMGTVTALLLSSALFAVTHAPMAVWPPIFLLGLALGLARTTTGSILPGAGVHLVNNLLAIAMIHVGSPAIESIFAYGHLKFAGSALFFGGVVYLLYRLRWKPKSKSPATPTESSPS